MNNLAGTIAGISTPLVGGAICIVRMSGEDAIKIADRVFSSGKKRPSELPPRYMALGTFDAKSFKEKCLCVVFKAPNSYTGEDMVEFQCHGGATIAKGVLKTLIAEGARMATAGEFSRRAFLSGKMTLADAEGMMDMILAESEAEVRAGYSLLSGELSKKVASAQKELVDILSEIEVSLDYPEEDIEYITKQKALARLSALCETVEGLLLTHSAGKLIKQGVRVAILGKPNVGKSSLLNALMKDEKAIVTPVAGTTRDIVEGSITINGLKFNLFDTAGIRETDDEVEKIGVDKAKSLIGNADIIVLVREAGKKFDPDLEKLVGGKKCIRVVNKADTTGDFDIKEEINLSAKSGKNVDELEKRLYALASEGKTFGDGVIIMSERHHDALSRALQHLKNAVQSMNDFPLDVITIDLNLAYQALGEITGSTTGEDIIDSIFSKFCLGK